MLKIKIELKYKMRANQRISITVFVPTKSRMYTNNLTHFKLSVRKMVCIILYI